MLTLRVTQAAAGTNRYRVKTALKSDGQLLQVATNEFGFPFTAQDREDLRWYLEDYLEYTADPAPRIAARIEGRIAELGTSLFKAVFHSSAAGRKLWATLRDRLNEARLEILTTVHEATSLPWELLLAPKTDVPLALRARAFVRVAARRPRLPQAGSGFIRILLVICRPGERDDVPFRSVAGRLVRGLRESARETLQLDVLRPPSFARLGDVLRSAKAEGKPYRVVHFDGHGIYEDLHAMYAGQPAKRMRGYLLFENPNSRDNYEFVHGTLLGKALAESGVALLVLNACRSAHAEPASTPEKVASEPATGLAESGVNTPVRAFGSLAQEVVDAGIPGIVAMRYNVYVVTAAQFVADLYAALTEGLSLGEAVTRGRKQLHDAPLREIAYSPRRLQDWSVPIVYEAAPIVLFPKPTQKSLTPHISVKAGAATPTHGDFDAALPAHPDVGFFGRDETLLALDRAFDRHHVALLWAYAGSGKTVAAAEFARWYALTGGVEGPVLFTSFEHYNPLERVLDRVGQVFKGVLEQSGVHWLALSKPEERRKEALKVLEQVPVFWIWDNVELIAGFPEGAASAWKKAEQKELADWLRAASQTRAKFLLTSRRDERSWLGDLPTRILVPPMPMQEGVQLARALAEKRGYHLTNVGALYPLMKFTHGNPLTLIVLVSQVLRDGLKTKAQIEAFIARLRVGETAFEDEASEGRSKSLGASLSYGFEHGFSDAERMQLALLYFFHGFVYVNALRLMGRPKSDWCIPAVRGLTRKASTALFDRAAESGLLTACGGGYYAIHPALPWFFKRVFDAYYPVRQEPQDARSVSQLLAARAFVEATGNVGEFYLTEYNEGKHNAITVLRAEESNLLHARHLARTHGWWDAVIHTMKALNLLYLHTGRRTEWARLLNENLPEFVDLTTGAPLRGREEAWGIITQFRVQLAQETRDLTEAEFLQRAVTEWSRQRARSLLTKRPEAWDYKKRAHVQTLSASLLVLGDIQHELGQKECIAAYKEALSLAERLCDRQLAANCALNLGTAYKNVPDLRDLAQAERWYQESLKLSDERDGVRRGLCFHQFAIIAYERFREARAARRPNEEILRHLKAAVDFTDQALAVTPQDAVIQVARAYALMGDLCGYTGAVDLARLNYGEAIRRFEAAGDLYSAAGVRHHLASRLAAARRFADAREYACAALRNWETLGVQAAEILPRTQDLLARIEHQLQAHGS